MKLFFKAKDGSKESTVTGYWLVQWKDKRMKIAIIDKAPSKNKYSNYFDFEFDLFHMSSVAIPKLLKKDIDLVIDLEPYDFVILVGSEAAKNYAKITSVTNFAGILTEGKFLAISNPATLQ